jgi:asparagine synthase (glutamine-hydrolysing)
VRGLIPDELIDRPKQGFGVPVYEWFFDRLGPKVREELKEFCEKTDFLDWKEVEGLLNRGKGPQAWYLFNLALWWKEYIA